MNLLPEFFPQITGFQWDDGNSEKNWKRHKVSRAEAEQVFLNRPLLLADDPRHSVAEPRLFALGRTDDDRLLAAVLTLRSPALRVISVRPMSRKERRSMPRRKAPQKIPRFSSEAQERAFWEEHDTADYVDWSQAKVGVFPNLKPSTETISLRLPLGLLAELKILANKRDIPYQSLLKVFLAERMARERVREGGSVPNKSVKPSARKTRRG